MNPCPAVFVYRAMRARTLALLLLFAAVCFAPQAVFAQRGSAALWESELRSRGVNPVEVPYPLAITDAMRDEAARLAGAGTQVERLRRLQSALFDQGQFPFQYEFRTTLTAAEAFFRRQGNCLSFTNMFVAMSRSIGIPVTTALVLQTRGSERDGDLIIVNNHVVAVYNNAGTPMYFDFDHTRRQPIHAARPLDDFWTTALYLNNRGGDELREGRPDVALRYFRNAVRLAPTFAPAWGNLGVAQRRLGSTTEALEAYARAVEVDPGNPTILTNLAALYRSLGRREEAQQALSAANYSAASPYSLLVRGDLELTQGRPREALRFFRLARQKDSSLPEVWLAMARAEMAQFRPAAARRHLLRAQKLQPDHPGVASLLAHLSVSAPPA